MSKQNPCNPPDVDEAPPPAYQETVVVPPPFNPHYNPQRQHLSPPHTPDINPIYSAEGSGSGQTLYPQIPSSPPLPTSPGIYPHQHYQNRLYPHPPQPPTPPQPPRPPQSPSRHYHEVSYRTIEIPYTLTTDRRRRVEHRRFPMAAIFFLFGWFCPPLWVIGACCCAGSRNQYEAFWGKVNFVMAMVLIVSSIIYSMIAMSQWMS